MKIADIKKAYPTCLVCGAKMTQQLWFDSQKLNVDVCYWGNELLQRKIIFWPQEKKPTKFAEEKIKELLPEFIDMNTVDFSNKNLSDFCVSYSVLCPTSFINQGGEFNHLCVDSARAKLDSNIHEINFDDSETAELLLFNDILIMNEDSKTTICCNDLKQEMARIPIKFWTSGNDSFADRLKKYIALL